MPWYVYIARLGDGRLYTGFTSDPPRRTREHFIGEEDARRREEYFKSSKGKRVLRLMLKDSLREARKVLETEEEKES